MTPANIAPHIPDAQAALGGFLATLLGGDTPLQIDMPVETTFDDARTQTMAYLILLGRSEGGTFAVMLDGNWLPLLAQAMLGEPMEMGDEGAEDLLKELAAQGYGAVRNQLGAAGLTLAEATFEVLAPGNPPPRDALQGALLEVSFGMKTEAQALGGFALLPAPAAKPKPSTPQPAAAAAQPAAQPAPAAASPRQSTPQQPVSVAHPAFPELGNESVGGGGNSNFSLLAEVDLEVTVELGRRKLPLVDVLRLTNGSVIELEKLVGEPLEVYANGRLIAEGEAVVIDEQFGIRITNLASTRQRAKAFL